jgi:hypothetical protein
LKINVSGIQIEGLNPDGDQSVCDNEQISLARVNIWLEINTSKTVKTHTKLQEVAAVSKSHLNGEQKFINSLFPSGSQKRF